MGVHVKLHGSTPKGCRPQSPCPIQAPFDTKCQKCIPCTPKQPKRRAGPPFLRSKNTRPPSPGGHEVPVGKAAVAVPQSDKGFCRSGFQCRQHPLAGANIGPRRADGVESAAPAKIWPFECPKPRAEERYTMTRLRSSRPTTQSKPSARGFGHSNGQIERRRSGRFTAVGEPARYRHTRLRQAFFGFLGGFWGFLVKNLVFPQNFGQNSYSFEKTF